MPPHSRTTTTYRPGGTRSSSIRRSSQGDYVGDDDLGPASGTRKRNNNRERARWRKFSPLIKHDDETNFSGLLLLFSRSGCHCRRGLIARIWIYFDWGGGYSYEVELLETIIIAPYSIFRISNAILPLAAAAVSHLPVDSTLICLFSQT